MHDGERLALAQELGEPNHRLRPSMAFMEGLHDEFHVEFAALEGRSALERPYGAPQVTIAEQFYRERLGRTQLLTADLMEINRTVMNVYMEETLLHPDVMHGSYDVITNCQTDPATRLTLPTHEWLYGFAHNVLAGSLRPQTMKAGLVRADMGKSKDILDYYAQRGRLYADHDRVMMDMAEDIEATRRWNPTYLWLPPGEQQLLTRIDRSGYHMPQDLLDESPESKWVGFHALTQEEQAFSMLLGLLDISGAQGDRIQNGSPTLNEVVVSSFRALWAAHQTPVPPRQGASPEEAAKEAALYRKNLFRQFRGQQLGLSIDQPLGRELIKLSSLMYYSNPEQAAFMYDVIDKDMQPRDRENLFEYLSLTGFESTGSAWIMYLPALLTRYREVLEAKRRSPRQALDAALTLAAQTYAAAKRQIDLTPGVVIVAADLVRAFEADPRIPLTHSIRITPITPTEARASFELAA